MMDAVTPESRLRGVNGTSERHSPRVAATSSSTNEDETRSGSQNDHAASAPPHALNFISPPELFGKAVPPREWIVQDWLPAGTVTLNYGDGGIGKTLLAQQLMTSCATAKPWCGLAVTPCKSLALFCEDDDAELHRRQDAINVEYGIDFDELGSMSWASGVGADNVLIRFDQDGRPTLTPRFDEFALAAKRFGPHLVLIDTAADTFGGNENDRAQVRQFIGNALGRLAKDLGAAVLVNAHPSRSGLVAGGTMDSGSTAWSNSARSRWALTRPEVVEDEEIDANERVLTRRKANYASMGDEIKLRWRRGVLVPLERRGGIAAAVEAAHCEDLFVALLGKCDASNMPVSTSKNAGNFAPKVFAKRSDSQGVSARDFDKAMHSLLTAGKLVLINYGRPGDERRRLALATASSDLFTEGAEQ